MKSQPVFVPTLSELGVHLGVSTQSIFIWRKKFGDSAPQKTAKGYKLAEWVAFKEDNALAEPRADSPLAAVKRRQLELQCTKLERQIDRADGKLIVAAELEIALGQMLSAVQHALYSLPMQCARFVIGVRDVHEVQTRLEGEVDSLLVSLGTADFFQDLTPEETAIVAKIGARALDRLRKQNLDETGNP